MKYEPLDLSTTDETYSSQILRILKKFGIGILTFIVAMVIIFGIMEIGSNLGWENNELFLGAMRGVMFGAIGASICTAKGMFNRK